MIEKIKMWWNGKDIYLKSGQYDHTFCPAPFNEKHWTSRIAHSLVKYLVKHQIWIIPTIITVAVSIMLAKPWK